MIPELSGFENGQAQEVLATGNLLAAVSPVPAFSSPWLYVLLVVALLSAGAARIGSAARPERGNYASAEA